MKCFLILVFVIGLGSYNGYAAPSGDDEYYPGDHDYEVSFFSISKSLTIIHLKSYVYVFVYVYVYVYVITKKGQTFFCFIECNTFFVLR
jgi:hypothetical protein